MLFRVSPRFRPLIKTVWSGIDPFSFVDLSSKVELLGTITPVQYNFSHDSSRIIRLMAVGVRIRDNRDGSS